MQVMRRARLDGSAPALRRHSLDYLSGLCRQGEARAPDAWADWKEAARWHVAQFRRPGLRAELEAAAGAVYLDLDGMRGA
jgi:hypothetical protein